MIPLTLFKCYIKDRKKKESLGKSALKNTLKKPLKVGLHDETGRSGWLPTEHLNRNRNYSPATEADQFSPTLDNGHDWNSPINQQ